MRLILVLSALVVAACTQTNQKKTGCSCRSTHILLPDSLAALRPNRTNTFNYFCVPLYAGCIVSGLSTNTRTHTYGIRIGVSECVSMAKT